MNKDKIVEAFSEFLDNFGATQKEPEVSYEVHKAVDEEQRLATFIVLVPDEVDLHGDIYNAVEVEKACLNFNKYCGQANIQHLIDTENAEIVESYVTLAEFTLDSGFVVKKGSWLQRWYFPETDAGMTLWKGVKKGTFTGLSIGCLAESEEIYE